MVDLAAHNLLGESWHNGKVILAWDSVLRGARDFSELQNDTRHGCRSLMNHYGATNPAEFFAVVTETFFEKPRQMALNHAELFNVLKDYYRIDPGDWQEK